MTPEEGFIYYTRAVHGPCEIRGNESPKREIVTKENDCPMRRQEIGRKRSGMKYQCCGIVVQQLWNLKWKAYEISNGNHQAA